MLKTRSKPRHRRPSRCTIALALTLIGLGVHCAGAQDSAPVPVPAAPAEEPLPASHTKMLALLAEIAERTETEHPLLSESRARQLRAQLEALPENAHPRDRVRLLLALGEVVGDACHAETLWRKWCGSQLSDLPAAPGIRLTVAWVGGYDLTEGHAKL